MGQSILERLPSFINMEMSSKMRVPRFFGTMILLVNWLDESWELCFLEPFFWTYYTLQGINISHLVKRKIIFKMPFLGDMFSSLEGNNKNPTKQNQKIHS